MSTNKTQNYQLHAWEKDDLFQLDEINENFTTLDAKLRAEADSLTQALKDLDKRKVQIVTGYYTGDGEKTRTIDLGVPILAVLVEQSSGNRDTNITYGGVAIRGVTVTRYLSVSGTGFSVTHYTTDNNLDRLNGKNSNYLYIAFLDTE